MIFRPWAPATRCFVSGHAMQIKVKVHWLVLVTQCSFVHVLYNDTVDLEGTKKVQFAGAFCSSILLLRFNLEL